MVSTILNAKPSYHFIGVGGIGMSGLAELLVRQGYAVSGSDLAAGAITGRLADLGVRVHLGHRAENLGGADVVVHSTAIKEDNPELAAARARGLTVLRRGQMLARLMEGHTQVAVTGMHGKTSTTAMTAAVLRAGNLDPTVVVGSVWDGLGSNAVLGRGEVFVAESDESDGSFALLSPEITIITNLDKEHLDYYRDLAHVQEMFAAYLERLPQGARVIACADDPHLAPVLADCPRELVTYSLNSQTADFYATDLTPQGLGYRFRLWRRGIALGTVTLPLAGSHYVLNAMAACAVGSLLGLEFPAWQQGLRKPGPDPAPLPAQGRSPGHPGDGRLRPPPHGDPLHPDRPGPGLSRPPPGGGLPAPPLQPHPGPAAGIFPSVPSGPDGLHHRDLRSRRAPPGWPFRPVRLRGRLWRWPPRGAFY